MSKDKGLELFEESMKNDKNIDWINNNDVYIYDKDGYKYKVIVEEVWSDDDYDDNVDDDVEYN